MDNLDDIVNEYNKRIKNVVLWTYVINDLNVEELAGTFYVKERQKKTKVTYDGKSN